MHFVSDDTGVLAPAVELGHLESVRLRAAWRPIPVHAAAAALVLALLVWLGWQTWHAADPNCQLGRPSAQAWH